MAEGTEDQEAWFYLDSPTHCLWDPRMPPSPPQLPMVKKVLGCPDLKEASTEPLPQCGLTAPHRCRRQQFSCLWKGLL